MAVASRHLFAQGGMDSGNTVTACAMRCAYNGQHVKCLELAVNIGARLRSERRLSSRSAQVTVTAALALWFSLPLIRKHLAATVTGTDCPWANMVVTELG